MEHDPEIQAFIRRWQPPAMPSGMNDRMMAQYHASRCPWWRRRLELHVAIPVPIIAAVVLGLLVSGGWWGHQIRTAASFREYMGGFEPVKAPTLIVTLTEVAQ
jgi:hypothetical protein